MTILDTDIKLRESERMADTPDGGGRRTNRIIPDGVAGNVFPKVGRVDAVYGRVNFRKIYPHVDTANLDVYANAHAIVTDAPDNDRIHVCLFSTGSDFDQRTAARDRVESYVISGPESRMKLYGRQLQGAQAILAYQRPEEPLPEIGEVFALSNETGGVTLAQQYVRLENLAHEVRTFSDDSGEFKMRVLTMTLGAILRYEFKGLDSPSRLSAARGPALLRITTVADAARYYGLQPLTAAGVVGELALRVASVYTPIVPTTQREVPISLASIPGSSVMGPSGVLTQPLVLFTGRATANGNFTLPRPVMPGTLRFTVRAGSTGSTAYSWLFSVDGAGVLTKIGDNNILQASYNKDTGVISLTSTGYTDWSLTITGATWAVELSQAAHTREIKITLGTRGTVHTPVLSPLPASGTLIVDYRALGKWYRLRDDGAGILTGGDAAYGTGTVNYVTGGVIITLGALPDVGSSILLAWGSPAHYAIQAGATADAATTVAQTLQLTATPVAPGSLSISWISGGVTKTAIASGGAISGHATGTVDATTGEVKINYGAFVPDSGTLVSTSHNQLVASGATPVVLEGYLTVVDPTNILLDTAVAPGSLRLIGYVARPATPLQYSALVLGDDGVGNVVTLLQQIDGDGDGHGNKNLVVSGGQTVGTINYVTGVVSLDSGPDGQGAVWSGNAWGPATTGFVFVTGFYNYYLRTGAASNPVAATQTFNPESDATPLRLDFTQTVARAVVPGSLMFTFTGKTYIDRNGTLYTDLDPVTGSGIDAGTFSYESGVANITFWANGVASGLLVRSCLTIYGRWTATSSFFRTGGSPLRPASTYVQVVAEDGTLMTGTADQNGDISGPFVRGKMQQDMGVARVEFGEMVTAAGNEAEPWYKPGDVVGGMIWRPRAAMPDTLRYSTVVLSNLPLNADILGLDPVRLPSDGRVPIYRSADVAVVHHTDSYAAGSPAAGATVTVGRTGLSLLWLQDSTGKKLSASLYTVNLAAGTATIAADAVFTGYTMPLTAKHRIEEMALLSDVQINGELTLSAPLLRNYPVGSCVSSALLFGDLFAHVTSVFDQNTWVGEWKDALIGSQSPAQYNDIDYPIEALNNDAISERWRINFTSTTAFQVIGEQTGVIATGTTSADLQPMNLATGKPYFTLRKLGWGMGWAVGNQLRFNTVSAAPPMWIARTVLPGATLAGDSFDAQFRGDVD